MPNGYAFTYLIGTQILFFIVTITLILWFVKNNKEKYINSAKNVLDNRLVTGDITRKEYHSLLNLIKEELIWKREFLIKD